jgi:hypothetical protein
MFEAINKTTGQLTNVVEHCMKQIEVQYNVMCKMRKEGIL